MPRSIILVILLLQPLVAKSAELNIKCDWQESSQHNPGFFRPATLSLQIESKKVKVLEDTFLYRRYAPCWIGNHSSCAFGFDYDRNSDWTITERSSQGLNLEAPGYYWDAELKLRASESWTSLVKGDSFSMLVAGDDGDGVMFDNERFSCSVL